LSSNVADSHFRYFAGGVARSIAKYGKVVNFDKRQKEQVECLIALEDEFRRTLVAHRYGCKAYRAFIKFICEERRNILAARPFFRERQTVFTKYISVALKERSPEQLYRFAFNIQFVNFVMAHRKWWVNSGLPQLADQIRKMRTEIVETNLPLAISRARIFYSRTPESHLSRMDMIQIAAEGLMAGVDKYSTAGKVVTRQFKSTALGRITGDHIEAYNETSIHFYPADKRKLYRAHKATAHQVGAVDYEKVTENVNEGAEEGQRTNPDEIADLLAAASTVSINAPSQVNDTDQATEPVDRFAAADSTRPDVQVENMATVTALAAALARLTVFERKLLRLRGVKADSLYIG
jgi:DNA-directed RNA polymerase specialized sigma subunit